MLEMESLIKRRITKADWNKVKKFGWTVDAAVVDGFSVLFLSKKVFGCLSGDFPSNKDAIFTEKQEEISQRSAAD